MTTSRHKTIIEVDLDTRAATRNASTLQRQLNQAGQAANLGGGGGGRPGPGPSNPPQRPRPGGTGGAIQGIGGLGGQAMGGMASGSASGMMGAAGGVMAGGLGMAARGMQRHGGAVGKAAGTGILTAIPLLGGAMGIAQAALNRRLVLAQQRARLNITNWQIRHAGGGMGGSPFDPSAKKAGIYSHAAKLGYGPDEAGQTMLGFSRQVGFRGSGNLRSALKADRLGVMGGFAAMRGVQAPGVGGVGDRSGAAARKQIALAFTEGLRGAKVDMWLQTVAQGVSQLGQQGLNINTAATTTFMNRLSTAGKGQYGMRVPRVVTGMMGALGQARGQLTGPFQQMASQALLAQAIQQGGSGPMGAIRGLESMGRSGPEAMRAAMVSQLGGDAAGMAFAGMGATSGMAGQLVGGLPGGRKLGGIPTKGLGGAASMAAINARSQASMLQRIDPKVMVKSLQLQMKLNEALTKALTISEPFVEKMIEFMNLGQAGAKQLINLMQNFGLPSDRGLKERIHQPDSDVAAKLAALPVYEWSYRGDDARHIGPMAQDWSAAFGGPEESIFVADMCGALIVTVQHLWDEVSELRAAIAS